MKTFSLVRTDMAKPLGKTILFFFGNSSVCISSMHMKVKVVEGDHSAVALPLTEKYL